MNSKKSCCICQHRIVHQVLVGDGLYSDFDVDIEHRCLIDGEKLEE
jgi:hypothetical protein